MAQLRALERALSGATRTRGPLDDAAFAIAIDQGLPTLIWSTGAIELAPPPDAVGHRVWEVEVLLGGSADTASSVIVTFDGEGGPRDLYRIDPAAVTTFRRAVGLPESGSPP